MKRGQAHKQSSNLMKAFAAIISVHRQAEKDLFFIFSFELKNMKKSKTNQHPSRTICFASNTIKPTIREKKKYHQAGQPNKQVPTLNFFS